MCTLFGCIDRISCKEGDGVPWGAITLFPAYSSLVAILVVDNDLSATIRDTGTMKNVCHQCLDFNVVLRSFLT